MNDYLQENKRSMMIIILLFLILLIVIAAVFLRPLFTDVKSREQEITNVKNELAVLEAKITNFGEVEDEDDIAKLLDEKKIPTRRELDNFIINLQKYEQYSGSMIESINIVHESSIQEEEAPEESETTTEESSTDEVEAETSGNEDSNDNAANDNNENENNGEADEADEEEAPLEIDKEIVYGKPEELHVMTFKVNGISPTYEDFIKFLEVIEEDKRISIITNISFTHPTERDVYFSENSYEYIPFQLDVTTFYYPN